MKTNLEQEEYPRLTPPEVVYEHKASLKKPVIIPLYAKVISAAAAVALLFGVVWHRSVMPKPGLMAELKPIEATRIAADEPAALAVSQARFVAPKSHPKPVLDKEETAVGEKTETAMLAELKPKAAPMLVNKNDLPDLLFADEVYYALNEVLSPIDDDIDDDLDDAGLSFVGRSIYKLTEGEHDSFASLLSGELRSIKIEMASVATTIQSSRYQVRQRAR